jgi:predicted MFS family arabinose efflux permease
MYLVGFMTDFAVMAGITALPFFIFNQLGGGAAMSGAFGAVQNIAYAGTCIVASRYVSRAKNGLHCALAGMIVFTLLFGALPFFRGHWLCGAIATVGFGALALVWPALHSWVGAEPDPVVRTQRMSWFNLSWSFGFALSPLFAGPLYDRHYSLPFVFMVGSCLIAIALLLTLPHEKTFFGRASQELLDARADHDRASEIHLYYAWAATMVMNALVTASRTVYPAHFRDLVLGGQVRILWESDAAAWLTRDPATLYSLLSSALSLASSVTFLVLARTHRWRHRFSLIFGIQAASAGAFFLLAFTRSLVLMGLCFMVIGVGVGIAFFSSVYYSTANPNRKHARASLNEGVVGIGGFLGSMGFGWLVGVYGLRGPFEATPRFVLAGLLFEVWLYRYGKRRMERIERNGVTPA